MGLRLEDFYDMGWNEYLIKCYAYNRMYLDRKRDVRTIAFNARIGSHLDPKGLKGLTIKKFMPLENDNNEQQSKVDEIHEENMRIAREKRAEIMRKRLNNKI